MAVAFRDDGSVKYFSPSGVEIQHTRGASERLQVIQGGGWKYTTRDDSTEIYDANGRLLSITDRNGFTQTLNYSTSGQLASVTDAAGRSLSFQYNLVGRLASITDSAGNVYAYSFTSYGNLASVTYPNGGGTRVYTYAEGAPSYANALGSVTDENNSVYSSYVYDSQWRVQTSMLAPNMAGGPIDQYTFAYNSGSTTVTTPLGQVLNYGLTTTNDGAIHLSSLDHACAACGGNNQAYQYDTAGYPSSTTDFNGRTTNYTYDDTRGMETQRIEASGTASQRTINTSLNANFRVPDQRSVVNASSVTEALTKWAYNTRGQVLAHCEIDPTVSGATSYTCGSAANAPLGVRQTRYTYCEQAGITAGTCPLIGLLLTVDGPRIDVSDVTTYTYYQTTDVSGCAMVGGACHAAGDLLQVTNALGQSTTYVSYDKNGRATRMSDANSTLTDMTYHPRGWLLTRTVRANANGSPSSNDATTTFTYDNVGQVTKITQPDGAYLSYTYDAAHRLTDITDNLSNTIHYTLDAAGNRTQEDTKDPSGALKRTLSRQYDQLSRLTKMLNGTSATVQQYTNPAEPPPSGITYTNGYDGNGNAVYSVDGSNVGSEQQYDPLNRLIKTLQDHAGTGTTKDTSTQYVYDARDNLRSVTDPDGLATGYTYDGLNNLTHLSSPDTGSTGYTYDAAGNRASQTDARGVVTSYVYDALNRLVGISYPTSSLSVIYTYDQAVSGCYNTGRLTTITDNSGSTAYCYDRRGNVIRKQQNTNGVVSTVSYTYTLADRLDTITYPSGAIIAYTRNALGQITAVTYKANATASTQALIQSATYMPFGPSSLLTFGNGRTLRKSYDFDYAVSEVVSSDPNAAYQLSASPTSLENYTYDKTGDRMSAALNGGTATTYSYTAGTHHLQSVGSTTRTYDANGNTTSNAAGPLSYDDRNRLAGLNATSTKKNTPQATYNYNGKGERVVKSVGKVGGSFTATTFVYGEGGQLLGEYTNGNSQEYIYLDSAPIGIATASSTTTQLYYLETDLLGTPRVAAKPGATTSMDTVVWKWDYFGSAFGTHAPSVQTLTVNLRFPGQYFDSETGLNYNYFRDYEPGTGRYVESDPTGLSASISTYSYVSAKPNELIDQFGLEEADPPEGPFDPGPMPIDPLPNHRDSRTPWEPPPYRVKRKYCAPYFITHGTHVGTVALPLVKEDPPQGPECDAKVVCHYSGSFFYDLFRKDRMHSKASAEPIEADTELHIKKTKCGCPKNSK